MEIINDTLWPHFSSLWNDLGTRASRVLLVAGGYGLYLKQLYFLSNRDFPTLVPLDRWLDTAPRVTKDMDLVVDLDLIADEKSNRETCQLLRDHGFTESDQQSGLRWQWMKLLGEDRQVVVELHTPSPSAEDTKLVSDGWRVKRKQSLKKDGIHGHDMPEAIGLETSSFTFDVSGVAIEVPNPITWTIMKLTAMRDRWREHEDAREEEIRRKFRDDAIKHGQDVCRVVALVSPDEAERLPEVIDQISQTREFQEAAGIQDEFFQGERCWATDLVAGDWVAEDFALIQEALTSWYLVKDHA